MSRGRNDGIWVDEGDGIDLRSTLGLQGAGAKRQEEFGDYQIRYGVVLKGVVSGRCVSNDFQRMIAAIVREVGAARVRYEVAVLMAHT